MSVKIIQCSSRGCGTRKKGGLYLFFSCEMVTYCTRLPMKNPDICPCCGEGFRIFRSMRVINPLKVFGKAENPCRDGCPICNPPEKAGLMWVGQQFYTPDEFREEARRLGISKRMPSKIEGLNPGDLVMFAHKKGYDPEGQEPAPGVFIAARLTEYQKVLSEDQAKDQDLIEELEKDGIVPVLEVEDPDETPAPVCTRGQRKLDFMEEEND